METDDDLTTRILNSLSALPPADQAEIILGVVGAALKAMSIYRILEIRAEIAADLGTELPLVRSAMELIDGQLALREIAENEHWR